MSSKDTSLGYECPQAWRRDGGPAQTRCLGGRAKVGGGRGTGQTGPGHGHLEKAMLSDNAERRKGHFWALQLTHAAGIGQS